MSDGICNAAADRWRSDAAADHAPPAAGPAALRYPVLPVVSPAAGVALLTLALVAMAADSQNRYAIKSAQHLANSALRAEVERLGGFVGDYAFWNDSALNQIGRASCRERVVRSALILAGAAS